MLFRCMFSLYFFLFFILFFFFFFFFSSRRRHTRCSRDWSSDVCSSDLPYPAPRSLRHGEEPDRAARRAAGPGVHLLAGAGTDFHPELRQVRLRSEEHTSELQSRLHLVCRLLLEKKK